VSSNTFCRRALLLTLAALFLCGRATAQSSKAFAFPDGGGVSQTSSGTSAATTGPSAPAVGYARIIQNAAIAAGYATFAFRQGEVLVSEATVPAATLVREGRIYAEIGGGVDTGIAIVNASDVPVELAYYFTDSDGQDFGENVLTLSAGGQIARFLSEAPFNGGPALAGTFTFFTLSRNPNARVGAIALRSLVNERGEFLMTTLPVTPVGERGLFSGSALPQFASGGGWNTQVILVNPTATELDGNLSFTNQAGEAAIITSDHGSGSVFHYRIHAKSSARLQTSTAGTLQVGSVRITTSVPGIDIPVASLIFSYQSGGVTVSTAGVPAPRSASETRLFVEVTGPVGAALPGRSQTGFAVSNVESTIPARVSFDLTNLDGTSTGLHGELVIPPGGQIASFVHEIPGLTTLPIPFQGVMRISAPLPVSVIGLRGLYNERGDFLVTTIPGVNANDEYFNLNLQYSDFVFPHFVNGGGYTTQFVLYSGWTPGFVSGTLDFFTQDGNTFPLSLEAR